MTALLLIIIYVAFISLGLPDSILGSAWPSMFEMLNVPVGYAGIITMIIAGSTIVSSLASNFLNQKLGTYKVMVISVSITAFALFGFSCSNEFWHLCLLGIPYGLGAGSVDAALNNYVALHYKNRHMSWLHCFWGVGTMIGPIVMSNFISNGGIWTEGYRAISIFQVFLVVILAFSFPLWKNMANKSNESVKNDINEKNSLSNFDDDLQEKVTLKSVIKVPGVLESVFIFLCYCSIESTTGLWASTYMVFARGIDVSVASSWAMLFFIGITVGRFINGFTSEKFGDKIMINFSVILIIISFVLMLLPIESKILVCVVFILSGLGCAPIYPCMIHSTPIRFGKRNSQALIGLQMACAYTGTTFCPLIFGLIVEKISVNCLPIYGLGFSVVLVLLLKVLEKKTKA